MPHRMLVAQFVEFSHVVFGGCTDERHEGGPDGSAFQ